MVSALYQHGEYRGIGVDRLELLPSDWLPGWATLEVASTFALVIVVYENTIDVCSGFNPNIDYCQYFDEEVIVVRVEYRPKPESEIGKNQNIQFTRTRGASYRYRSDSDVTFGVGPIDFQKIERGEHIFIIGGNGSGKSTFARLLTGLYRPHSGQVYVVDGNEVARHLLKIIAINSRLYSVIFIYSIKLSMVKVKTSILKDIDEWGVYVLKCFVGSITSKVS